MTTEFHVRGRYHVALRASAGSLPSRRAGAGPWILVVTADLAAVAAACVGHALWDGGSVGAFGTATTVGALAGLCLLVTGAWDRVGVELGRLLRGFAVAAAVVAVLSLAVSSVTGRTWVFGALPVACALAVAGRLCLRPVLWRRGAAAATRVLAVGSTDAVSSLAERVRRAPQHGWQVVAACTPTGTGAGHGPVIDDIPVVGDLDAVPRLFLSGRFDAICVAPTAGWSAERLRRLVPHLQASHTELLVDPGLSGRTGPLTHLSGVDGLQLVRLTRPALPVSAAFAKAALDRTAALLLLVLTAPLLAALAVAVGCDRGPILVRGSRGDGGALRFRTTGPDGSATRVGELLQRHGLDALPQLFRVLAGSLALVGPRPPVPGEGREPPLVTPGLIGLHGMAECRYVETWSPMLDARLLTGALRSACRRVPR